jgi:hypothetical protein
MQRQFRWAAYVVFVVSGAIASTSRAEGRADVARAETLFQAGRQLMREGRYAEACPQLEESQKLDPAPGTRLNLADCWEHTGRTASAQREFLALAQSSERSGETERAAIARERAKQLENRLTKLTLLVPKEARVPGLTLLCNAVAVDEADWDHAQAVDPGHFVIEARAPGRRSYKNDFSLPGDAAVHTLSIPVLLPDAAPASSSSGAGTASRAQWLQRGGLGLAGLGVVGIALGSVFGVRAVSLYHRSQDEGCDARDVCTPRALETRRSAVQSGNVSTVSFVAGGLLLAGGAGLYVWGSRERATQQLGLSARVGALPGGGYAGLDGQF